MYRVLIVDNEPIIVDGLFDLFQEVEHVELNVHKAYSASEALNLLSMHKIDILFADIQMPGMNGLELQQRIKELCPRCKVIFLTGFNEFAYVQTALRNGSSDFILKTEGDTRILEAFDKAIAGIQEFTDKDRLLEEARHEMNLAKPLLQKEYVTSLLDGDCSSNASIQQRFEALGIRLRTDLPVMLVVGRVDEWPDVYTGSDRFLLMFAIHNIAQELLDFTYLFPMSYDKTKFIWFVQTKTTDIEERNAFITKIHETLDSIQSTCKNLLKITISLVTHQKPCQWSEISSKFDDLKRLLNRGLGLGKEILLTDKSTELSHIPMEKNNEHFNLRSSRNNVMLLESYLGGGAEQEFALLCRNLLQSTSNHNSAYMEMYYRIATLILSFLNRMEVSRNLLDEQYLDDLMRIETHKTWEDAVHYFTGIARILFEKRHHEKEANSHAIVNHLHHYIHGHIDSDLSLNKLSEIVYLNPSYLSRLYKQVTNHGLTEYISKQRIEKATSLLEQTSLKIHEVARHVGLEQGYFIKMFKRYLRMTPQEYRETYDREGTATLRLLGGAKGE